MCLEPCSQLRTFVLAVEGSAKRTGLLASLPALPPAEGTAGHRERHSDGAPPRSSGDRHARRGAPADSSAAVATARVGQRVATAFGPGVVHAHRQRDGAFVVRLAFGATAYLQTGVRKR